MRVEVNGKPAQRLQPVLQELGYNPCMGLTAGATFNRVMPAEMMVSSFLFVFF